MLQSFNAFGIWAMVAMALAGVAGELHLYLMMTMMILVALGLGAASLISCVNRLHELNEIDADLDSDFDSGYNQAHQ